MEKVQEPTATPTPPAEPPIVSRDPRILGGKPIVAGQRVYLSVLLTYGDTPEGRRRAQRNFPSLTQEQVDAAFAYWRAHPNMFDDADAQ